MATYCISDIHGEYEAYKALLAKIGFSDSDVLYVLGDAIDRGPRSMDVLLDMMMRPNVIPLIGNHEYMALQCLRFLASEITEESLGAVDDTAIRGLLEWQTVGGSETIESFGKLTADGKADVLEYLEEFSLYEEVRCGREDYVLVHAGLMNFSPARPLDDYTLPEMVFRVPDYSSVYYPDKYLVTGHLPTMAIRDNPAPNRIYRANRHIAIDCGCTFGGSLAAICLETGEEFYI